VWAKRKLGQTIKELLLNGGKNFKFEGIPRQNGGTQKNWVGEGTALKVQRERSNKCKQKNFDTEVKKSKKKIDWKDMGGKNLWSACGELVFGGKGECRGKGGRHKEPQK